MLNKVILMGRLCADPELKQTQSGHANCRIRLAVNRTYRKDGEEQKADFITVTAWRQTAEFIARYFRKGSMMIVEGSLRNNDYTDSNGVKHYSMEVLADNVSFGESKRAAEASSGAQRDAAEDFSQAYATAATHASVPQFSGIPGQERFCPKPPAALDLSEFEEVLSDGDMPF